MNGVTIERDARVLATDGEVGRVRHVIVDHQTREVTEFVVEHNGQEWTLPVSAIAEAGGGAVRLRGSRAELNRGLPFDRGDFHAVDDERAEAEATGQAVRGGAPLRDAADDAVVIGGMPAAPAQAPRQEYLARRQAMPAPATAREATEGALVVPVAEERLTVGTREAELGEIQIRKTVTEEGQTVPVTLRHDEVNVREVDVADRPLRPGEDAFGEGTIRVPVRGEEAVVAKEAVVTGEVVVEKETVAERRQITDTVRKQRVVVDETAVRDATGTGERTRSTRARDTREG